MSRKFPYTELGIKRLSCFRCGHGAQTQWQICSDGNTYRPLCLDCDIALNQLVLEWMGFPDTSTMMALYAEKMNADSSTTPTTR